MTTPTAPADDITLPALPKPYAVLGPQPDAYTADQVLAYARVAVKLNCASPSRAAVQSLDREALVELIAQHLSGTYHCGRVWAAWSVGTMSEDDFSDVGESDTPGEIADAIMAKFAAPGTAPAPVVQPVAAYGLGDFFRDAKRTGLTADSFAAALAARPEFADCLQPVTAAVDVGAAQAETAQAAPAWCSYCGGAGDVHGLDGEWRGECTECPVAITRTFKNFHANLCKRFGYAHDEKGWQRDLVSLEEHIAKLAAQATPAWCQCPACAPVLHASDCAVHNAPALPVGACDCGAAPGLVPLPATATKEMMVAAVKFANGDAVYKNVAAGALEIEEQIYGETWEAMVAAFSGAKS